MASVNNDKNDEAGLEAVSDRLKDTSLTAMASIGNNKPDYRELDLGSPVSPLRARGSGPNPVSSTTTTNTTSSSGSSSGSVTGRAGQNPGTQKAHSGELGIRHARSDSCGSAGSLSLSHGGPLIYSGGGCGSGGGVGGGSGGSVNSPPLNVLPTGNICPSGRISKPGGMGMMASANAPRQGALGSGHGQYGHGSIMRSGGGSGGSGGGSGERRRGEFSEGSVDLGRRSGGSVGGVVDPEEVKRLGNEQYKKGHFSEALSLYDRAIVISPANAAYRSNRAAALTGLGRISEAVRECEEAVRLDPCYGRAHLRLGSLLVR